MTTTHQESFRVGVDIGGTFTDIVLIGDDGTVLTRKVSSTPRDYSLGIAEGVGALLADNGISPAAVVDVVHATTVATNAVLEGKGAKAGLITTEGFRDVLEFRRVRVPELYNLAYVKPKPLVPRRLRLEVRERMAPDGAVRVPLDEATVVRAAQRLRDAGVEAVAICLLHSYANGAHERRVAQIVRSILPDDTFVTCSHEVLPEMREYERTSTTVVNAFLGPVMKNYLGALRGRLDALGIRRPLHVMQSGGGQMGVEAAIAMPANLVESGPAAGVIAAARLARQVGIHDAITLDIGGTTAKTAMVENGEPTKTGEYEIGAGINLSSKLVKGAGYAIKLPFIDVSEIGAGGGSYVWFDKGGLLKVGPQSAGSVPGPVCYGTGGTRVTLTDALLALGYVNPDYLVGGALRLHRHEARRALARQVCEPLGCGEMEAAYGVFSVAVANMVRAVKSVSTYRGRDPRDYTLIAFGGNGPIVASAIAADIGIRRVLVPPYPGVLSSIGLLLADGTHERVRALPGLLYSLSSDRVERAFNELEADASQSLVAEGHVASSIETTRLADLRYAGQAFELTVALAGSGPADLVRLARDFHGEHQRTYGHMAENEPVELVNLRIVARVPIGEIAVRPPAPGTARPDGARARDAYFGPQRGLLATPVIERRDLGDDPTPGPLVVEEYDSTIVVPPGCGARTDAFGNVLIALEA